ncbi:MAG TPA: hypothetical protein VK674_00615 [Candidatus Limnocylindria bacterium]|nr:hypothetical protein [Candidatus Limnocylindria bacterium]
MQLSNGHSHEEGLQFTGLSIGEQAEAIKTKQGEQPAGSRLELEPISPVGYLILDIQRREEGRQLLDRYTQTRFVQLAGQLSGQRSTPAADSFYPSGAGAPQVRLLSMNELAFSAGGVRVVERVKTPS